MFNRRKKNNEAILLRFNNYRQNIEINQAYFLDTKLNCVNGIYKTMVHRKTAELLIYCSSKELKRYKCNW